VTPTVVLVMLVMPYLFRSQRSGGRTPRSGSVDKPVMGAFCAGSYEVTPPGRSRATTSSTGPTDRPKDSNQHVRLAESQTRRETPHPSSLACGLGRYDRLLHGPIRPAEGCLPADVRRVQ